MKNLLSKMSGFEKKIAGLIGLFLAAQSDKAIAQNFIEPIDDPFGLKYDTLVFSIDSDFVDIDNDGDLDFFLFGYQEDEYGVFTYLYHENVGTAENPEFAQSQMNPFGSIGVELDFNTAEFADMDDDGDFDVVLPKNDSFGYFIGLMFYENVGTKEVPLFQPGISINLQNVRDEFDMISFQMIDLDMDGDLDFLSSQRGYDDFSELYLNAFAYAPNTSTGNSLTFGPLVENPFGLDPFNFNELFFFLNVADLDQDNDLDILTSSVQGESIFDNYTSHYYWYENGGNAQQADFANWVEDPFNLQVDESAVFIPDLVDLDNDGDYDLFAMRYDNTTELFGFQFYENDQMTSVKSDKVDLSMIKLYPNPTADQLFVQLSESLETSHVTLKIYNSIGVTFYNQEMTNFNKEAIYLAGWPPGLYSLLVSFDGKQMLKKFVKN
jgi:hypothetical protein